MHTVHTVHSVYQTQDITANLFLVTFNATFLWTMTGFAFCPVVTNTTQTKHICVIFIQGVVILHILVWIFFS